MFDSKKFGDEWARVNGWMMEKLASTQGGLSPINREAIIKRPKPKLDYQVVLENASRTMIRFRKPERLLKMIVRLIDEEVNTSHTAVLLYKEQKKSFVLIDSKGEEGVKIPINYIRMTTKNPLIKIFIDRKNYMISDTGTLSFSLLKELMGNKDAFQTHPELEDTIDLVLKQMDLLKAEVCIPCYYKKDLKGVLILGPKISNNAFSRQEIGFFMTLANDAAMAIANTELIQDLQEKVEQVKDLYIQEHKIFIHTAIALATAIDARDKYTHGHTERVTQYCMAVAEELEEIPEAMAYKNFKEILQVAALLHDVGKIGCPDKILNKKTGLTKKEYAKIQDHPVIGSAILTPIKELSNVAREVRYHHEKYDGTGYPYGKKGIEIPLVSRIIAVCDVFDAITSDRPYRRRKSHKVALEEIRKGLGTQFDPLVVGAFLIAYEKGNIAHMPKNEWVEKGVKKIKTI